MKTETISIQDLNPGDKIFVKWPENREKPNWWKLPEIVTVKAVDIQNSRVDIKETGGLCLKENEFQKITDMPKPEPGDHITFYLDQWDNSGLKFQKEFTALVKKVDVDPMKRRDPKCIVIVNQERYGIPFTEIKSLQKNKIQEKAQQLAFQL